MNSTAAHAGAPLPAVGPRGFSLVELLLATVIGSLLLIGLANSARLFGEQVSHVQDAADARLEQALVSVTDAVSAGWRVQRPSATRLEVTDALGRTTVYEQQGSDLVVTRPSGASGALLAGVASVDFATRQTRRYVEAAPRVGYAAFWTRDPPAGPPTTLTIHGGEAVAIGFSIPADAPPSVDTLADVEEEFLDATLDRLVLALSFFDGSSKEFCHLHASGPPHDSNHATGTASLAVDVYESRAPGDARPWGPVLGTADVPTPALPPATYTWLNMATSTPVTPPEVIDPPAGVAWGWWDDNPQVELVVDEAPAIDVPVDLVPLGATIRPGRGYALVLRVSGVDYVNIEAYPLASTADSNVAFRASGPGAFVTQPLAVPLRLEGVRRWTQTGAHEMVSRVTTTIVMQDGTRVSGTASVLAQTAVADAWSGPVPGAPPALALAGQ
jgi:prepilin-type N-terminal cleavage/methylation domain-containing protein